MRRRSRLLLKVLGAIAGLLLAAAVGTYWYERPLLLTATGYAAHNACALATIAQRADPASDLPPNPLVPYLRDKQDAAVTTATILGVLAGQQAWESPGFGCTLADARPDLGEATTVTSDANPFTATAPSGHVPPGVREAIDRAFGDDLSPVEGTALGTRAVVVIRNGELVAERYADGFTATTPQLGWSMAKSVTNLLVGRLVQRGQVAIDETALRSEWTDERASITVDHLMRMTSGLHWDETYDLGTPITEMLYLQPDMAKFAAAQPLDHQPGTYQQYSSGSTNILCSYLRQRSGIGADLPRREVFAPLGLSSAVWEPDASGTPVCSSYLWATPRDWAAIGQFALQEGRWRGEQLLPGAWMERSTTASAGEGEDRGYAAGWWVNRLPDGTLVEPDLPADSYWASGHDGQRLYVVPSADLVVVRLGFSPSVEPKDLGSVELVRDLVAAPTS